MARENEDVLKQIDMKLTEYENEIKKSQERKRFPRDEEDCKKGFISIHVVAQPVVPEQHPTHSQQEVWFEDTYPRRTLHFHHPK